MHRRTITKIAATVIFALAAFPVAIADAQEPDDIEACISEPALTIGSQGDCVRVLQEGLRGSGFGGTPTGEFDEDTRQRVCALQSIAGTTPDGIVGTATWSALLAPVEIVSPQGCEGQDLGSLVPGDLSETPIESTTDSSAPASTVASPTTNRQPDDDRTSSTEGSSPVEGVNHDAPDGTARDRFWLGVLFGASTTALLGIALGAAARMRRRPRHDDRDGNVDDASGQVSQTGSGDDEHGAVPPPPTPSSDSPDRRTSQENAPASDGVSSVAEAEPRSQPASNEELPNSAARRRQKVFVLEEQGLPVATMGGGVEAALLPSRGLADSSSMWEAVAVTPLDPVGLVLIDGEWLVPASAVQVDDQLGPGQRVRFTSRDFGESLASGEPQTPT